MRLAFHSCNAYLLAPTPQRPVEALRYFYSDVWVGTPPTKYSVITDTGSTLMAFPCADCPNCGKHEGGRYDGTKSSTAKKVGCGSGCPGSCDNSRKQCSYSQSYTEGSSLRGVFWEDQVWVGAKVAQPAEGESGKYGINFKFGCHTYENGLFTSQLADGIMGLGRDGKSIIAALRSSQRLDKQLFGMCLSLNGGALTLGGIDTSLHTGELKWQAFTGRTGFYTVATGALRVGNNVVKSSAATAIVDSGTSFTYLPGAHYAAFMAAIKPAAASVPGATLATVRGEDLCYRLSDPAKQLPQFPSMDLAVGALTFHVRPEHLFFNMVWDGDNVFCLGVYNNGGSSGVIGANAMMGYDVIFDLEQNRLGLAPATCTQPAAAHDLGEKAAASPAAQPSGEPTVSPAPAAASSSAAATASSTSAASASPTHVPAASPSQPAQAAPSPAAGAASPTATTSPAAQGEVGESQTGGTSVPTDLHWQTQDPSSVFGAGFAAGFAVLLAIGLTALGCVNCRRSYCSCGGLVLLSTSSQLWVSMVDAQARGAVASATTATGSKFTDREGEDSKPSTAPAASINTPQTGTLHADVEAQVSLAQAAADSHPADADVFDSE